MSRQEKEQKLEEEKKKRDTKFAQGVTMRDLQRCDFKIKLKNSRQDMYFVLISLRYLKQKLANQAHVVPTS